MIDFHKIDLSSYTEGELGQIALECDRFQLRVADEMHIRTRSRITNRSRRMLPRSLEITEKGRAYLDRLKQAEAR